MSVVLQCPRCCKEFTTKRRLLEHIRKATACHATKTLEEVVTPQEAERVVHDVLNVMKPHKCKSCDKRYSHKSGLCRHEQTHKLHDTNNMRSTNNNISGGTIINNGNHNTVGNNNTSVNINCPVIIVPHGQEDLSQLLNTKWLSSKGFINETILSAIRDIHFNPDNPENMNVYVSNLKNKVCKVFSKLQIWEQKDLDETIDNAYDRVTEHIQSLLDDLEDNPNRFHLFQQRWDRFMEKDRAIEVAKEDIKMTLYNLRDLVKKVHGLGKWSRHR